ncbi:hypothetical protein [Sphingomonas sp. PvP056]|jgi:hypothetical protein|uniref:hypothetical protein n=1 Tax=Sphingomonas sp. PvP056 TaxID=3156392 RepID=UPI00339514B3
MAAFDDTFDPELGAACNRLAAWVEPLPEGTVIDPTSRLTERDLALILRRLHATRMVKQADQQHPVEDRSPPVGRASVPITVKG